MVLDLGTTDDVDATYLNGEKIGGFGTFPQNVLPAHAERRIYTIPYEKVLWDRINVLAVRVYDNGGGGGIIGKEIFLSVKGAKDLVTLKAEFPTPNHIWLASDRVILPVMVKSDLKESLSGILKISCRTDFGEIKYQKEYLVVVKSGQTLKKSESLSGLSPGFYWVDIELSSPLTNKKYTLAFGVSPEKIVSPTDSKPDFEAYWNRAKKELAAVDPQYKLILNDTLCTPTKNVYVLEMRSLGNALVRGWLSVPKKPGRYPAILHVQGYSSFLKLDWAYQGDDMVVLALNIRGHGFSKDNVNPGFPGYLLHQVLDKEMYIYRGAYMDCTRALDYLFTRPDVDTTRLVVEGGSQGGALSFATAALNPQRVALCIPHVPFLSDFKDYFRLANWPTNEFNEFLKNKPDSVKNTVYTTLSYIDIKNLAPYVKCPVLMGFGMIDEVCPPHINFAAYNQIKSKKEYVSYPFAGHGIPKEYHQYKFQWTKQMLEMTK